MARRRSTPQAGTDPAPDLPEPAGTDAPVDLTSGIEEAIVLTEPHREAAAEPAEEAVAEAASPPRPAPPRRGGFWGPAFGGLVAAAIGGGAALALFPQGLQPRETDPAMSGLTAEIETQKAALTAMEARLQAAESAPGPDLAALRQEILAALPAAPAVADTGAVDTALKDLEGRVSDLDARLKTIESRPVAEAGAAPAIPAEVQSDIAALRQTLDAQAAEIADLKSVSESAKESIAAAQTAEAEAAGKVESADAVARQARAAAALAELRAAIDSGASLAPALDALAASGLNPPESLRADAEAIPTLDSLQKSFPDAARAALAASAEVPADAAWTDKVSAFFQSQTHARSLAPREGNSPDAVLSRIEAAVQSGDLSMAVAKTKALPEPAQAALAEWLDGARRREAAEQALKALSADAVKGSP